VLLFHSVYTIGESSSFVICAHKTLTAGEGTEA
jgi:hypothetical protein